VISKTDGFNKLCVCTHAHACVYVRVWRGNSQLYVLQEIKTKKRNTKAENCQFTYKKNLKNS